jgi:DNA repair protein RadC
VKRAAAASACHERREKLGVRVLTDAELLTILLSTTAGMNSTRDAAQKLLAALPISKIACAPPEQLEQQPGIGPARAAAAAAFDSVGGVHGRRRSVASGSSIRRECAS